MIQIKKVAINLNNGKEEIRIKIDYEKKYLLTFYHIDAKEIETLFDSTKLIWADVNALNSFIDNPVMGKELKLGNLVLSFIKEKGVTHCKLNFRKEVVWAVEMIVTIIALNKIL